MRGGVRSGVLGVVASVTLHGLVMVWLPSARGLSVAGEVTAADRARHPFAVTDTHQSITLEVISSPVVVGAPRQNAGRDATGGWEGGDGLGVQPTWLLDETHAITLQDSLRNSVRNSQVQRIDTASDRATQENRRAALQPNDQVYLATGPGWVGQRAPYSRVDAANGTEALRSTQQAAGHAGTNTPPQPNREDRESGRVRTGNNPAHDGAARAWHTQARGQARSRGVAPSRARPIETGRPDVDQGPPATLAADVGRVRDNRDAELRASELMRAFVQAGSAFGATRENGHGGPAIGGEPATGRGIDTGRSSDAYGGGGDGEPGGERYIHWYTEQRNRIRRALVFPRSRQLAMDQGTTLLRLALGRDGGLLEPPRILRSSGFGDLDEAALAAVLRSAPFSPLPDEIAPETQRIRLTVPVEFWNPTTH